MLRNQPSSSFWVAGSLVPGSDPQAAGAALERSGWVLGGDGTRRRDGATLTLTLLVDDDSRRLAVAQFVANAWRGIGIQATVEAVGLDGLVRDFALPGRYDALLLGVRGNDARPPLAELWHTNGALNLSGWSDPVADAAIEATNAADAATEELGYERFSRQFADQVPGIPLYLPTARFAANGVALSPWLLADEADILRGAQSWQPLGLGPPA